MYIFASSQTPQDFSPINIPYGCFFAREHEKYLGETELIQNPEYLASEKTEAFFNFLQRNNLMGGQISAPKKSLIVFIFIPILRISSIAL